LFVQLVHWFLNPAPGKLYLALMPGISRPGTGVFTHNADEPGDPFMIG
jgi:hypothetical protein